MVEHIQPGGWLVAIDSSIAMIEESRRRHGEYSDVRFQVADVQKLDYPNESFDRCRVDRTRQHIANPKQAILEMKRVLHKKGVIVSFDNDWETFTINSAGIIHLRKEKYENDWINELGDRNGRELNPFTSEH